ncbi:cation:proton antiporter domain-containing protein [Halomonas sp. WWR20]
MAELNIALVTIGGVVLVLGLLSRFLNRSWQSPPLLAFCVGVALGPLGLGWLDSATWPHPQRLMEEAARLALGITLMSMALRLPPRYLFMHWREALILGGIVMPVMCLVGVGLASVLLGVPLIVALLMASSIASTDCVVASSIVSGDVARRNMPGGFRHMLPMESGVNVVYPVMMLAVLLTRPGDAPWSTWWLHVLPWEVGGSVVLGILLGLGVGRALRWAESRHLIDQPSFLSLTVALTLLVLGASKLLDMANMSAVFAAGVAFDQQVGGNERSEAESLQETINQLVMLPVFVLLGVMAPWHAWADLGIHGVWFIAALFMLRRLPVILALRPLLGPWRDWRTACLAGWFGPIGVSALYYSSLIITKTGDDIAWKVGSLVVLVSLVLHGMSATPLARLYGRSQTGQRP